MLCAVVVLVTMHYLVYIMRAAWWKQQPPRSWPKRQAFLLGGREVPGCQCVPRQMSKVATPWVTLAIYNASDVHSHWSHRAKRIWSGHSLELVTALPWWRPWGQSLLPWNTLGLKWLGRRLGGYIMKCTNWRRHPAWTHAMQRWQRISIRRSLTQLKSASGIGGNAPSWRRNQGEDLPPLPGQNPSLSFSRGSMPPMTTSASGI